MLVASVRRLQERSWKPRAREVAWQPGGGSLSHSRARRELRRVISVQDVNRMHTSRAALDRLLDPDYDALTLSTLRKAAVAVGREIRIALV